MDKPVDNQTDVEEEDDEIGALKVGEDVYNVVDFELGDFVRVLQDLFNKMEHLDFDAALAQQLREYVANKTLYSEVGKKRRLRSLVFLSHVEQSRRRRQARSTQSTQPTHS